MESCLPCSFFTRVYPGSVFSLYVGCPGSYWLVSNDYPLVIKGPFDKGTALKIMDSAHDFYNIIKLKGLL